MIIWHRVVPISWLIIIVALPVWAADKDFERAELEASLPHRWTSDQRVSAETTQWQTDQLPVSETDSAFGGEEPMPVAWWQSFGEPRLVEFVELAIIQNRDLRQTAARLETAAAEARIAGADLWPQIDTGFASQRQQQNFVGLPIPGSDGRVLSARFDTHSFNVNLSWELDLWGRVRAGKRAAKADVGRAASDYRAAQLSLMGRVIKAWWLAAESARQWELSLWTATNQVQTATQIQSRYERGVREALDLRLARSTAASAQAQVLQRQREYDVAIRQLEVLLGEYPSGTLVVPGRLPTLTVAIPAGIPSELLRRRPDLVASEQQLEAALARVKEAKAALWPRIALTASGGRTSGELEDLLSNSFNVWSLAGNLAQPLFQGGRLRASVARSKARAKEALEVYAGTILQAMAEVENGLSGEEWLAGREHFLDIARREAEGARRLAEQRYLSGLEPYLTLLEAQRRAWETESQWLTIRRLRLDNRVDLHLALGGDFEVEPEQINAPLLGRNP
jgi:NodT family efflux transporter outer membrane factor (OMF) lipoprotein